MPKYIAKRTSRYKESQEAKALMRQTMLLVGLLILLIVIIPLAGLPAIRQFAIFLGSLRSGETVQITSDITPPQTPLLNTPLEATNSSSLTLSGYAEPLSTVTLYINNRKQSQIKSSEQGEFEITEVQLQEGPNAIHVIATDEAGNDSPASTTSTVLLDTAAPSLEINSPADGDVRYGRSEQVILVEGSTDPDVTVTVNQIFALVDSSGSFRQSVTLQEGTTTILIVARDKAGNETEKPLQVEYKP